MNESPLSRFSDAYLAALRIHCTQDRHESPQAAHEIGREAVASGLETLDLAIIHDHALIQLLSDGHSSARQTDLTVRAAAFFTEAITLIEETHTAALTAAESLDELHAELDVRLLDLADANDELQRQVTMRSLAEATLRKSQHSSGQLLLDSQVLERQLRDMTRQILSATESERRKMSRYLDDEIGQTLLAINVRFLALKSEVSATHADITREIAATQRLVTAAAKTISNLAHEFNNQQA